MIERPDCAACGAQDWETLEHKRYLAAEASTLDAYLQRKYRLLFATWFPNQAEARITVEMCRRCGFVAFAPRPTEREVAAKYELAVSMGGHSRSRPAVNPIDAHRSRALHAELAPHLAKQSRVLDYGGGDGRLMAELVHAGHACSVVDFIPTPVEGVTRLGSTLDDLPPKARFDAVVLSHVLEHVAEPRLLLSRLRAVLNDAGLLLVEVPMELFRRVPPEREPVTHINFFQPESLRAALESSGLQPITCSLRWHYSERQIVVRALARVAEPRPVPDAGAGPAFTHAMLRGDARPLIGLFFEAPLRSGRATLSHALQRVRKAVRRGKAARPRSSGA